MTTTRYFGFKNNSWYETSDYHEWRFDNLKEIQVVVVGDKIVDFVSKRDRVEIELSDLKHLISMIEGQSENALFESIDSSLNNLEGMSLKILEALESPLNGSKIIRSQTNNKLISLEHEQRSPNRLFVNF